MECVTAVRAGLGSIIPLQLLSTLSPLEMELRTCGLPHINLEFLKVGGPGPGEQATDTSPAPAITHCHSPWQDSHHHLPVPTACTQLWPGFKAGRPQVRGRADCPAHV